jgi:hypothetical protein
MFSLKTLHKKGPIGRANLFTDVFCKIKLEILGHICAIVSHKGLNIHGDHKFEFEKR